MATRMLTSDVIHAAIAGFEAQKQRIDAQIAELRGMLNGTGSGSVGSESTPKKGTMSAAGRRAIAEAQRKRWAAAKGQTYAATPKPKRKLSKAGRAAIVAALKKRWAAKKAAAKT